MNNLFYVCPYDGKKFSKVEMMRWATVNVKRTCPTCHRRYSLTITPIQLSQGWAHSAQIIEVEEKIQNHWPGERA